MESRWRRPAYGINTARTVYRMDDVPIPLRPAFESPYPSDEEIVRRIAQAVGRKPAWLPGPQVAASAVA